ncbi:MAG: hypothetical protein M3401_01485 [Actinomycetota bacterium]|nr:hypothetical protein [Actinomycetota bacterium]
MPVVERKTADQVEVATAQAMREIRAAVSATVVPDPPPQRQNFSDNLRRPRLARAVGHGTIRLLAQAPRPSAGQAMTTPDPGAAAAADPVGHGTIRVRGRTAPPAPALPSAIAESVESADAATMAARDLAAIATS